MLTMDIFRDDAFRVSEMTDAVNDIPNQWGRSGEMGLFGSRGIRTVTFEVEAQEKRPDKKIYQITEAGRRSLVEKLCAQAPKEDKIKSDLLFILFFANHLPPERVSGVIDERIDFYREKLAHLTGCDGAGSGTAPDLVRGFGVTVYNAAMSYLEEHRQDFINLALRDEQPADAAD